MLFYNKLKHSLYNLLHYKNIYSNNFSIYTNCDTPLLIKKGYMHHLWDTNNNKYIDLTSQNLCISIGHVHPTITINLINQIKKLQFCNEKHYKQQSNKTKNKLINKIIRNNDNLNYNNDWKIHFFNNKQTAIKFSLDLSFNYTNKYESVIYSKKIHNSNNLNNIGCVIFDSFHDNNLYDNHFKNDINIYDQKNIVKIIDETKSGVGRLGNFFNGYETYKSINPDIIILNDALCNGICLMNAVICHKSLLSNYSFQIPSIDLNPISICAINNVLQIIEEDNMIDNCNYQGEIFSKKLDKLCLEYPSVFKNNKGMGLFHEIEITGKTIDNRRNVINKLKQELLKLGILINCNNNMLQISPPLCIDKNSVKYVCGMLEHVVIKLLKEI